MKPVEKKCTKCGEVKPANREFFHPRKDSKDGLRNQCKTCINNYKSTWLKEKRQSDPIFVEKQREYSRLRDRKNRSNPEWVEKYNKYRRDYDPKYRAKKKSCPAYRERKRMEWRRANEKKRKNPKYIEYMRDYANRRACKNASELTDRYIKHSIMKIDANADIPPEIIETKRNIIKLKRELKKQK